MSEPRLRCPSCRREIPLPPQTCPCCGAGMVAFTPQRSMHPAVVVVLLFFVLGPLALGMLWRNDKFTRAAKWALTVLVCLYTAMMFYLIYVAVGQCMAAIDEAMNKFQM